MLSSMGVQTTGREYSTSERFIHDDLLRQAGELIETMKGLWQKDKSVESFAFSWPATKLRADDGAVVEDLVMMRVPEEGEAAALRAFVQRTRAYGLLLIRQEEKTLIGLFETHRGARAWRIPLERRGDRWGLGKPVVVDDRESVGILWSPRKGTS